ncbi:MAG: DUF1801 domain-containing protein [Bacteroidota bacterium]
MLPALEQFYDGQEEPNQSCLLALRSLILQQDEAVNETQKWGMPCFCYRKKMFCFLWVDKDTQKPYLLLVEGNYLDHPQLEQGKRSRMKIFRVNPTEDLPVSTISSLLNTALDLYRTGVIKVK